ncbi:hypothetical protein NL676_011714 [Syzygium grande]|nr:hypothetical protein NL676_011714 [Syzygium grande]
MPLQDCRIGRGGDCPKLKEGSSNLTDSWKSALVEDPSSPAELVISVPLSRSESHLLPLLGPFPSDHSDLIPPLLKPFIRVFQPACRTNITGQDLTSRGHDGTTNPRALVGPLESSSKTSNDFVWPYTSSRRRGSPALGSSPPTTCGPPEPMLAHLRSQSQLSNMIVRESPIAPERHIQHRTLGLFVQPLKTLRAVGLAALLHVHQRPNRVDWRFPRLFNLQVCDSLWLELHEAIQQDPLSQPILPRVVEDPLVGVVAVVLDRVK